MPTNYDNLPRCVICDQPVIESTYYQNRHVHEACYAQLSPEQKEADPFETPKV